MKLTFHVLLAKNMKEGLAVVNLPVILRDHATDMLLSILIYSTDSTTTILLSREEPTQRANLILPMHVTRTA